MTKTTKIMLSGVVLGSVAVTSYYTFFKSMVSTKEETSIEKTTSQNTKTTTQQDTKQVERVTYKDGTYVGEKINTRRGEFQFSVTVENGLIKAIDTVTYPTHGPSEEINSDAIPKYVAEAIKNQNSNVTLISGATETYSGFTGSVQDAINKAL